MSLAKYIDLISTKSIFCSPILNFTDKTECEWLEHGLYISHMKILEYYNECKKCMEKINNYIFNLENPSIKDIKYAFDNLISKDEKDMIDYSDDVRQVTTDNFLILLMNI